MNDKEKQARVKKEFDALETHIGKKVIITYVSAIEPLKPVEATLLEVERYKKIKFKRIAIPRFSFWSFFIWEHYGIQKITTLEGVVLYENTTLDFSLSDDTEKLRNMLKETKFGTAAYNTNYAKFKDEVA